MGRVLSLMAGGILLASCLSGCLRDASVCAVDGDCASTLVCEQGSCVPGAADPDTGSEDADVGADADATDVRSDVGTEDGGAPDADASDADAGAPEDRVVSRGAFRPPADIALGPDDTIIVAVTHEDTLGVEALAFTKEGPLNLSSQTFAASPGSRVSLASDLDGARGTWMTYRAPDEERISVAKRTTATGSWTSDEVFAETPTSDGVSTQQYADVAFSGTSFYALALEITSENRDVDREFGVEPIFIRGDIGGANPASLSDELDEPGFTFDTATVGLTRGVVALWSTDGRSVRGRFIENVDGVQDEVNLYLGEGRTFRGGLVATALPEQGAVAAFLVEDGGRPVIEVIEVGEDTGALTPQTLPRIESPVGAEVSEPSVVTDDMGNTYVLYMEREGADAPFALKMAVRSSGAWSYRTLDPDAGRSTEDGLVLAHWDSGSNGAHVVYMKYGEDSLSEGALTYMWVTP